MTTRLALIAVAIAAAAPATAEASRPRVPLDTGLAIGFDVANAIPSSIETAHVDVDCRGWWRAHRCLVAVGIPGQVGCRFAVRTRRRGTYWRLVGPAPPCWTAIQAHE